MNVSSKGTGVLEIRSRNCYSELYVNSSKLVEGCTICDPLNISYSLTSANHRIHYIIFYKNNVPYDYKIIRRVTIKSNFIILPPYLMKFYFEFKDIFKFDFDYGEMNYSIFIREDRLDFLMKNNLVYSTGFRKGSGILSIDCRDGLVIDVLGKRIILAGHNCTGCNIIFSCDKCRIGPIGVTGKISFP